MIGFSNVSSVASWYPGVLALCLAIPSWLHGDIGVLSRLRVAGSRKRWHQLHLSSLCFEPTSNADPTWPPSSGCSLPNCSLLRVPTLAESGPLSNPPPDHAGKVKLLAAPWGGGAPPEDRGTFPSPEGEGVRGAGNPANLRGPHSPGQLSLLYAASFSVVSVTLSQKAV